MNTERDTVALSIISVVHGATGRDENEERVV